MNEAFTELQATVKALQAEVDTLKSKVRLMEQAVDVYVDKEGRLIRNLECESFILRDENKPQCIAIHMGVCKQHGTFLDLNYHSPDKEHLTAVCLKVDKQDDPHFQIHGKDEKVKAAVWLDKGSGTMGVYRATGVPAAVMRGLPTGGSVAVVQPDGRPRAVMLHHEEEAEDGAPVISKTEITLLGEDTKRALTLMEDPGGSTVKLVNTDAEATLLVRDGAASLMMDSAKDASSVLLVATEGMAKVAAQEGHALGLKASASLSAGTFGGNVSVNESSGLERVNLSAMKGQGMVQLMNEEGDASVLLMSKQDDFSELSMRGQSAEPAVRLMLNEDMSSLQLKSPQEPKTGLLALVKEVPSVMMTDVGQVRSAMTISENCGQVCAYGPGGERAGMASISGGMLSGCVSVATADGTRLVEISGTDHGGRMALNNDLGLNRIMMGVHDESAGIHLNHTGTDGLRLVATPLGGIITAHDSEGNVCDTLGTDDE